MPKTKNEKQQEEYRKTRTQYLQDRVKQTQDKLRAAGLTSEQKKSLQDKLKSYKDNLLKIKTQSKFKETTMSKLSDKYRASVAGKEKATAAGARKPAAKKPTAKNPSTGPTIRKGASRPASSSKPAAKKPTAKKPSSSTRPTIRKGVSRPASSSKPAAKKSAAPNKLNSGSDESKLEALQEALDSARDNGGSRSEIKKLSDSVKRLKQKIADDKDPEKLQLRVENAQKELDKVRSNPDSTSSDIKIFESFLAKAQKEFDAKKPAPAAKKPTAKKPTANTPAAKKPAAKGKGKPDAGKDTTRYTKRGVTQMLKQLRDAQEKGRKDSAAYKQRDADIKRLTKVLKTLGSLEGNAVVASVADNFRISTIASSLEETASGRIRAKQFAAIAEEVFGITEKPQSYGNSLNFDLGKIKRDLKNYSLEEIADSLIQAAKGQGVTLVPADDTDNGVVEVGEQGDAGVFLSYKGSEDDPTLVYNADQYLLTLR